MSKEHSQRYVKSCENLPSGPVALAQAVEAVKGFPATKFDSTVELVMHLGVDPRQADQNIRGALSLPHGIGATRKVIAFCEGELLEQAKAAGAVEAGGEELVAKIQDGWMDFDVAVAHPSMMRTVSKLGRVLGPQGKMPSPKAGTVSEDIAAVVTEYSAGKVEYRNDAGGNLHVPVGKASFEADKLVENIDMFITHIKKLRPASMKGAYIKKVSLSSTMSPSVQVDVQ